jgi:hypothetical protein
MDKLTQLRESLDRLIEEAVREDMARVYGERRETPRESVPVQRPSIFLSRQAE